MASKLVGRYKNAPERRMNARHLAGQERLFNYLALFSASIFWLGQGFELNRGRQIVAGGVFPLRLRLLRTPWFVKERIE